MRAPHPSQVNYLALGALRHYARGGGDAARTAAALYARLRANLLRAVLGEWAKTGALYEQYDDRTGRGMRSHPFTGWTALILNIAAEEYD